jgi:protein tyrosine phosphatase type IVA
MVSVANKPSFVEYNNLRFLILDAPTDLNLEAYLAEFKAVNVTQLVRACECGYNTDRVKKLGIDVLDIPFPDGEPPPEKVIAAWLKLCETTFAKANPKKSTIAVHCVAGLGRAPILVAIALIENGMEPLNAVQLIRSKRKGAINVKQLSYLENEYKPRKKCSIM